MSEPTPAADPVAAILRTASAFAQDVLAPNGGIWERERRQPETVLRDAIRLFSDIAVPEPLEGRGLGLRTLVTCYEVLAAKDLGFTCALAVHNAVTAAVSAIPDRALVDRYLPALMAGRAIGAFSLTEPHAGSDAAAIRCEARETAQGFTVTGSKAWVTNGTHADLMLTFCQSDATQRAGGIVGLVIRRDLPGVTVSAPLDLIGSHAMGTTDLAFSDTPVPRDHLAFGPGQGFAAAMSGLNVARIGVAAMCNGALAGAIEQATRYATGRQAFGKPIFENQGIQFPLAEVATTLEASRALTERAAALQDGGQNATIAAAHAKKYATRAAFLGISQCLQVLGANGLKDEIGLGRQLASSKVCEFMDGTTEIQNLVIARSLAKNFGAERR